MRGYCEVGLILNYLKHLFECLHTNKLKCYETIR